MSLETVKEPSEDQPEIDPQKISNLDPEDSFTPDEVKHLVKELRTYRLALQQASVRPIRLPSELTIGEYNFLVTFLKKQRIQILKSDPKIPKEITDKKGNVLSLETE